MSVGPKRGRMYYIRDLFSGLYLVGMIDGIDEQGTFVDWIVIPGFELN